jgi:hypothetical protein
MPLRGVQGAFGAFKVQGSRFKICAAARYLLSGFSFFLITINW